MNIGFYAGHEHFLIHSQVLLDSLNKAYKEPSVTIIVPRDLLDIYQNNFKRYKVSILGQETTSHYPFFDKIQGAALYEAKMKDHFLWLDVDTYFINTFEPDPQAQIQVHPVDKKNIGILHHQVYSPLWVHVLSYFNPKSIKNLSPVKTKITKETIHPYYNMGCVWIGQGKNIFQRTHQILHQIQDHSTWIQLIQENPLNQIFIHQVVFSCALLEAYGQENIKDLPSNMNFPIHLYKDYEGNLNFDEFISFRYDDYFNQPTGKLNLPQPLLEVKDHLKMIWYYI